MHFDDGTIFIIGGNVNMKLIINADDFGYTKGVTEGIVEGYLSGIIRSTTVLTNMPYIRYGSDLTKDLTNFGMGVHLTLTLGKSLTGAPSITNSLGYFKSRKQFYEEIDQVKPDEVYEEFKAQIETFIHTFHKKPDHLDSHHSVHDAKGLLQVSQKLANEYAIPMRRYSDFIYVTGFYDETATVETLITLLEKHHNEDIEIMTHPGYCDLELYRSSSYHTARVKELDVLCDERMKKYIEQHQIVLTNYEKS